MKATRQSERQSIRPGVGIPGRWLVAMIAALALFVLACGGSETATSTIASSADVVVETKASPELAENAPPEPEAVADTTEGTDEELAIEFVACMRDEGVDMDDPTVNSDGTINLFGGGQGQGAGRLDDGFADAADVCGDIIEGATFFGGGRDLSETEDDLLAFAQCLRDQGLEVDDPNLANLGSGGGQGLFGEGFDPQDPANAEAVAQCQGLVNFGAGR